MADFPKKYRKLASISLHQYANQALALILSAH